MPFKKGNQAAKGREMPEGQIALRKLTRVRLETIVHKYMDWPMNRLKELIKDPGDAPAIELIVVAVIAKAISQGDDRRLESLIARVMGKVPDRVEFRDETDTEEIERLKEEYRKIMKKPK